MLDLGDLTMSKKTLHSQSHEVYSLAEENGKVYSDVSAVNGGMGPLSK